MRITLYTETSFWLHSQCFRNFSLHTQKISLVVMFSKFILLNADWFRLQRNTNLFSVSCILVAVAYINEMGIESDLHKYFVCCTRISCIIPFGWEILVVVFYQETISWKMSFTCYARVVFIQLNCYILSIYLALLIVSTRDSSVYLQLRHLLIPV